MVPKVRTLKIQGTNYLQVYTECMCVYTVNVHLPGPISIV